MEISQNKDDVLNTLLSQVKDSIESEKDVIAVSIHKSLVDLGFIQSSGESSGNEGVMFVLTRTPAGLVLNYKYQQTQTEMQLTIFSLGKILQIHCYLPANSEGFTLTLKNLGDFVSNDLKLLNSVRLEDLFKMSVGNRLRHKARLLAGVEKGLLQVPDDAKRKVLRYLDYKSVINVSQVNTKLWALTKETLLWKHLLNKHYPSVVLEQDQDPYDRFVNETKKALMRKKRPNKWSRSLFDEDFDDFPDPFSFLPPPRRGRGGNGPPPFFPNKYYLKSKHIKKF